MRPYLWLRGREEHDLQYVAHDPTGRHLVVLSPDGLLLIDTHDDERVVLATHEVATRRREATLGLRMLSFDDSGLCMAYLRAYDEVAREVDVVVRELDTGVERVVERPPGLIRGVGLSREWVLLAVAAPDASLRPPPQGIWADMTCSACVRRFGGADDEDTFAVPLEGGAPMHVPGLVDGMRGGLIRVDHRDPNMYRALLTVGERTAAIGDVACRLRGQPRSEHEGWFDVECFGSRDAEDLRVEVTEEPIAAHPARSEAKREPYEPWRLARAQTGEVLTARHDCSCGDAWVMGGADDGEVACVENPGFRCGPARWERAPTQPKSR